jgi:hypothetical protein
MLSSRMARERVQAAEPCASVPATTLEMLVHLTRIEATDRSGARREARTVVRASREPEYVVRQLSQDR